MNEESQSNQLNTDRARAAPSMTADTLKKIMWLYRTRTCPLNKRGQCNYGVRCFDSHESQPERRAPKQNEYNDWHPSTMKCTSNADESCKYGRACYFAHNDFEVNYHPTMYKTQLCTAFDKERTCSLGMICPNYHYPDEQRKIEKGSLSADCKSDGISRKAPPPQEFRRWLDEELRIAKMNGIHLDDSAAHIADTQHLNSTSNANGHNAPNALLAIHDKDSGNKHERQMKSSSNMIQQAPAMNNVNEGHKQNASNKHVAQIKLNEHHVVEHNANGIENEVEIQLPSTQNSQSLHLSHSLMEDSPSTRFVSSATGSPPYVEHIDEKWHQQNMRYNNNQSRPEHYLPSVPSASPHLNRALSTPQMEHTHNEIPPPSRMQHAHSHHGAPSIASYRSNRSSNRSQKSGKSSKSKSSSTGSKSKKSKRKNGANKLEKKKKRSRRQMEKKRNREKVLKQATDIINSYKVTRCPKSKCNDIYCVNYHNLEDRRRSPSQHHYVGEACVRIFDIKTRKFTDNCYGCPANENCEFAHNYLEIWYHPTVFHTKRCPLIKYEKNCPWGFKCSHYHRKSHKRNMEHLTQKVLQQQQQQQQKYSPLSSSQYSSHSHSVQTVQNVQPQPYGAHPMHAIHHQQIGIHSAHGAPPNLTNVTPQSLGPHRPPLTTNRVKPALLNSAAEISSPYSASSSFSPHLNHLGLQHHQNGMLSPHFAHDHNLNKSSPHNHQNDASYSYNPLMQGIAPSIHSWRQKIDKNVGY